MKTITKSIIVIICIVVTILVVTLLSNNFLDNNIKIAVIKFVIILLVYECIVICYVNYKNKKYSKLPIKETVGRKIEKIKSASPEPNFENPSVLDKGWQSAKYSFEIDGKTYEKMIKFEWKDNVPEELTLYYRIGKRDIDKKTKTWFYEGRFQTFLAIVLAIVTYILLFR